jgi:hypothetical protein
MTLFNGRFALLAGPTVLALALAGCGGSKPPAETAAPAPAAEGEAATGSAPVDELAAREEELAKREAELALKEKEAELARREAELAAREKSASRPAATSKPAASTAASTAAATPKPVAAAPKPVVVPAGTTLSVEIVNTISTKTAKVGDPVVARLSQPLTVDGRTVAVSGAEIRGRVSDVYSGSKEIGGTPKLGVALTDLALASGSTVPISAGIVQEGARESGKDAAKIGAGAVIGAVIGHQVDDDKGKVIGGLLGAGAGAAAAKRTGGDIEVPAGTVIGFVLNTPIEVK